MTHAAAVNLLSPATDIEWHDAGLLIDELIEWDVSQSEGLSLGRAEVIGICYPDSLEDIRRDSAGPDGCFLLATGMSGPAGCAAFRRFDSEVCELYDAYVRRAYRGCGIGTLLVRRLQSGAIIAGYRAMYLETATFMHEARRLYDSLHFEVREHYRTIPKRLAEATIAMQCNLRERTAQMTQLHEA